MPSPQPLTRQRPERSRPRALGRRATEEGGAGGRPAPARPPRLGGRLQSLSVVPEVVGPHARLGLVWAVITVAAAVAGPLWLGPWLAATAGLAGAQAARRRSRRPRRPAMVLAGVGAAALTLAGAGGPVWVGSAAVAVAAGGVGYALVRGGPGVEAVWISAVALVTGLAGAAPVLLRTSGLAPLLVLLAYAMVYDASAYVVGSGAASAWEGPTAGIAATGTVTLTVAAVLVPPFEGVSPWVLGSLAAVLTPLGPLVGTALLGDRHDRAPALRRLDSLLLLGPVWSLASMLLLD